MFSGYVDGLKKLLFYFPKEKREEIIKKYASRTPEPLNQQFLLCVVFFPYTVINTSRERLSVFPAYVPTKPPRCPSICNGSDEPICKHKSEK